MAGRIKLKKIVAVLAASTLMLSLVPAGAFAYAAHSQASKTNEKYVSYDTYGNWFGYFDVVDEAESILKNKTWNAESGKVTNSMTFWHWLESELAVPELSKVHIRIDESSVSYEMPIAGTPENPAGVAGSFNATIYVYRSWIDILAARKVPVSGIIEAVPYVEEEKPNPPVDDNPDKPDPNPGGDPQPGPGDNTDNPKPDDKEDPKPSPGPDEPINPDNPDPVNPDKPDDNPDNPDDSNKPVNPDKPDNPDNTDNPNKPDDGNNPNKDDESGNNTPPSDSQKPGDTNTDTTQNTQSEIVQSAAAEISQTIEKQLIEDETAWTMDADEFDNIAFEDEAAAEVSMKMSVQKWVSAKLAAMNLPEGVTYEVGEPVIEMPTETAEGSFECPVFLSAEDAEEVAVIEARGLSMHPLNAAVQTNDVSASLGVDPSTSADDAVMLPRTPDLVIKGKIAPRKAKLTSHNQHNNVTGIVNRPWHPLINAQNGINSSSSDSQSDSANQREIKRPQQLSDDKRNTPSVTTVVQQGSSIAITQDLLAGSVAVLAVVGVIAAVVAIVCLLLMRGGRGGRKK